MAKRKVFKTVFEIAKEEGELKGKLEGELKGKLEGEQKVLRKAIFYILKTTSLTDAQIAVELETDEAFIKSVRQEFMSSQQQA
jgi:predicted transposase YdaD